MADEEVRDVDIAVSFVTRLPERYRVSESAIEVPGRLTRYGLSEVVNHLLGNETPTPFDFLVDGNLLRTSLAKLALRLGKSAEATLVVEYVPALAPPAPAEKAKCDDWVSSIDGSWAMAIATGSFDGKARLWSPKGDLLHEFDGHGERVCSVSLTPPSGDASPENCVVLSASADGTVRSHAVTLTGKECVVGETRVFKGHTSTVLGVASAYGSQLFATCSVDGTARVWRLEGGELEDEKAAKKRKKESKNKKKGDDEDMDVDVPEQIGLGEELVLSGHTDQVHAVAWESSRLLWTASYDHTIRAWDVETGQEKESNPTNNSVHCLAVAPSGNKYAFGGSDRLVNVWDPRESTSKACLKLKSHEGWVSCIRWNPSNDHHLVSSGYDGSVKLWDIRGKVPLHSATSHDGKIFAVDYHGAERLVSGGDDGQLRFWNVGGKLQ